MLKRLACAGAALLSCLGAYADDGDQAKDFAPQRQYPEQVVVAKDETPLILRLLLKPIKQGMLIRLPVVDTDPNRGITAGAMPVWVIREPGTDRIEQIHAPSLTYNKHFGAIPTYRYYYYPASDATLVTRAAVGKYEHEILAQYDDQTFLDTDVDIFGRVQWNTDSGQRFFGIGPDTSKDAETNFKEDYIQTQFSAGLPLLRASKWRLRAANRVTASKVSNGPLKGLQGFEDTYPGVAAGHQQVNELKVNLVYDSRDHSVTTSRGALLEAYAQYSVRGFASSYDFNRYGLDGRFFYPWPGREDWCGSALQFKVEQIFGKAPFVLMPRIGGKYALRAYGDGRYIDRGMAVANLEQRFTVWKSRLAGVMTEFETAPFVGLGTVFDTPGRAAKRYARPVVGVATRAVARPQVVGSVDFGVGQEGLAVFMDINYSF